MYLFIARSHSGIAERNRNVTVNVITGIWLTTRVFLSRVSILTRDIDIANLSVRPFICLSGRPLRSGIV